jgi:geranylgeranyl diphosphate synthase type II
LTTRNDAMERQLRERAAVTERALENCLRDDGGDYGLREAMRYAALGGGKRIRAVLTLSFAHASGGDMRDALDAACAVEMLHAYSLIHDDLPCMDDSDLRRGKPSNHIIYGEWMATLAGDALQAAAFERVLSAPLPPERTTRMALTLARAAGPDGICGGQAGDMSSAGKTLTQDEVRRIHERKTAALFKASARMGVEAVDGGDERVMAAERYADSLGLAFQIRDDLLDATSDTVSLGKPARNDEIGDKNTFASLLGAAECERIIEKETRKAVDALRASFEETEFLIWLAHSLSRRER